MGQRKIFNIRRGVMMFICLLVKKNNNVQYNKYLFRVYDFHCLTVNDFNF